MDEQLPRSFVDIISKNYSVKDAELIYDAYNFAAKAHQGQTRLNGASFISHSVGTAQLLAGWKLSPPIVAAGLLHDVSEDTRFSLRDIEQRFGNDIAHLVEGETKLDRIKYKGTERYAENLRKMFMAIAADVRVIFIKFADRIHNLQTLDGIPEYKQKRIALETLEIYASIANRLGMGAIKGELEDLAFKYVYPEEYEWALELEVDSVHKKEEHLEKTKTVVERILKKNNIKFQSIHGRVKHLYSLYQKLLRRERDIDKVYDLVALRVIVPTVQDCYAALGLIHQCWTPLKGRIKDYIAQPKPNGYQSLHTTVFCDDGEIVEFQIRTPQMHEEAEFGVAAHWFYNEQGKLPKKIDQHVQWLKGLVEMQKNIQDRDRFLEAVELLKIDFFKNRIFVFTPKGDVVDLPEEATPVDYAYAIHTEIGNHCSSAMVNEQIASLSVSLRSGDMVRIITDKNKRGPSADWLKFTKTAHARDKIRENLKRTKLAGWMKELVHKRKGPK